MMTNQGIDRFGPGGPQGAPPGGVEARGGPSNEAQRAQEAQASAAFRALLEKFEANAEELERRAESLEGPESLKEAVSSARRSVNEALNLGSDLLEAYRAAQQRSSGPEEGSQDNHSEKSPRGGR